MRKSTGRSLRQETVAKTGIDREVNLGANLTPIGALAGIMWMTILAGKEVPIPFPEFVKYGLLVTPASLLACRGVLALQLDLAA